MDHLCFLPAPFESGRSHTGLLGSLGFSPAAPCVWVCTTLCFVTSCYWIRHCPKNPDNPPVCLMGPPPWKHKIDSNGNFLSKFCVMPKAATLNLEIEALNAAAVKPTGVQPRAEAFEPWQTHVCKCKKNLKNKRTKHHPARSQKPKARKPQN